MSQSYPNLFLIGAMRSGTTTLHHWLSRHPDVCMSAVKEPNYFTDLSLNQAVTNCPDPREERQIAAYLSRRKTRSLESYLALFETAGQAAVVGESSHYLFHPATAQLIRSFNPDARILVMLRNPVDRMFSDYLYQVRRGRAQPHRFQDYFENLQRAEAAHAGYRFVPRTHLSFGLYAQLLPVWLETFGKDRVFIGLFDDLEGSPASLFRQICQWLGVDETIPPPRVRAERSGIPRQRFTGELLNRGRGLRAWLREQVPDSARLRIRDLAHRWLLKRPDMSRTIRDRLNAFYEDDVMRLQSLIGRDLSHWLEWRG